MTQRLPETDSPARQPIATIVNPRSANGRTARAWRKLQPYLEEVFGAVQVYRTRAPLHASELARQAVQADCKTIVVVGGDGTLHEVVNGLIENDKLIRPDLTVGVIAHGTGADFRRTLAIPIDAKAAIEVIRQRRTRLIDVARVRFHTREGTRGLRYGINVTSFGMGGLVAARSNRSSKILGGRLSFQLATALTTLTYRSRSVCLQLEAQPPRELRITNIAIGNTQHHGGGMWVCPRAVPDDGLLDVTVIPHMSVLAIIRNFPLLYSGRIYEHPGVEFHRVPRLEATADEDTWIEVDGEMVGKLPIEISVLPRILPVYVP